MILKKCQMYSQLSLIFEQLLSKIYGKKYDCQKINSDTSGSSDRVNQIITAAPDCCCESCKMSKFSKSPIDGEECVARFVFSPMHINTKTGQIKPSIISHVFNRGCSIQRDTIAPDDEINRFISKFLSQEPSKRTWNKVLVGKCSDLRNILIDSKRALCLYDTAEKDNPAHGEICLSREISEADQLELRYEIMKTFSEISPNSYRNGRIHNHLTIK